MALELRRKSKQYLKSQRVAIEDNSPLSEEFFGLNDFPKYFGEGKNSFRIRPRFGVLKPNTKIDIEVLDSNGNPIYWEIPTYKDDDKSRLISVWIYDVVDKRYNTPDGPCELFILVTLPYNQKVRWSRRVDVVKNKKSVSEVVFREIPRGNVSASIETFSEIPQSEGSLSRTIQAGQFTYKKSLYGDDVSFEASTAIINREMVSGSLELDLSSTTLFPRLGGGQSQPTRVTASITEVISNQIFRVSLPITSSDNRSEGSIHTYEYSDGNVSGEIKYLSTGSVNVTQNQVAIANITLSNVNPVSGRVSSVNTLIKSQGLPNADFELIANTDIPNERDISYKVAIPTEQLNDPKTLKIQFLNKSGDVSTTEVIIENVVFEGGNVYIGGNQSIVTGSLFIANAIGSGLEIGGHSSGFMKSVGYEGQISASEGKGPGGFIIYSGSNALQMGADVLQGVGMQFIGDNDDRHFIFTTHDGGLLDVKTDKFFIGTTDSQFISGSDGNIEISSSLFHLDPVNDLLVIGADAVINADLSVNNLRTPAIINGSPSTRTNSSSSIDSDGFARFVSASIGGFEVSETQINSANDNLILKDSGQITGSNVLFSGGEIAGFEISNSQINSTNNNLILKASGQITASDGFLFGNKGTSQYVQFDDGNLVVRGDLSVDQIFTPATINGSPANINNASSSITSDGFAKFVSASIGGWDITTGSIEGGNLIMKPEGILQTKDFASGLKGWKISSEGNGTAEFENVRIRGTMRTTTFEKESANAVGGQLWVANSTTITGSVIANDATMSVKNAKGFVNGEILLAKKVDNTGFQTEYILVNSSSLEGDQSNEDENYGRLYVTRGYGSGSSGDYVGDIGSISQSYEDGQVVVSTGKIGTGYIKLNANPSDQATPIMDIVERTGSGLYAVALAARLGDLSGLAGSDYVFGSSTPGYGLATNNVYLQGCIKANTGSIGGINMEAGKLYNGNGTWANSNTGFYIDSASNFSLGDRLTWNGTSLVVRGQIQLADGTSVEEAINAVTESSTARALSIGVDSQVYAFDNSADTTATPDTIVFTISQQNLTGTITTSDITITKDGGSTITTPTLGGVVTNGSGQLSGSLSFSGESLTKSDLPITIEVSKDSLLDTTTIFKVEGGADGAAGADGADGVSTTGFRIEYSTSTTEADPGSGKFRFNAADPASATEVYISETDLDGLGVAPLLNQLTSSTNTPNKSIITFRQEANQAYYESAYVTDQTDNGSWRTVDITHIDKNGWANLSNGDSTFMAIAVLGDSGE